MRTLSSHTTSVPRTAMRLVVALLIGIGAAAITLSPLAQHIHGSSAADLQWPLDGARVLLRGHNPYGPMFQAHTNQLDWQDQPLWYPLPAVLLVLPLTPLPDRFAMTVFVGLSACVLAYSLTKRGWEALLVCASAPFFWACLYGQWAPLVLVAALTTAAAPLSLCKPSLGLAAFAYRPTKRGALLIAIVLLGSFSVVPTWPWDWRANLAQAFHRPPLWYPYGGLVLLLAGVCWRQPAGRLLLIMASVPQSYWFYDQVALALVAPTTRLRLLWVVCSWGAVVGYISTGGHISAWDWTMWGLYFPALGILVGPWLYQYYNNHRYSMPTPPT
jgi:hypothetical protein